MDLKKDLEQGIYGKGNFIIAKKNGKILEYHMILNIILQQLKKVRQLKRI